MTDFDIKETVTQSGYVDRDGKFIPETDPSKATPIHVPIYTQSIEDVKD